MSAKTSATSAQSAAAKDKTMTLLKKPETIVGVVVLSALGILAVNTFSNSGNEQVSSTATESAQIADVSETSNENESGSTPAATETPAADEIDAISMLANTSSHRIITAKSGDSFWTLAEDFCGTGAAAENMERANGYRFKQLQAGDVIEVICQ